MPARRAVLIACERFRHAELFADLRYPARDALRLEGILKDPFLGAFDDVQTLVDPAQGEARRAVERLVRSAASDDAILFYYSGHGKLDRDGSLAFALPESEPDYLASTSLSSNELKQLFNLSRAG